MSRTSEILPAKHNSHLLQDPWQPRPGESLIPTLLPVKANGHVLDRVFPDCSASHSIPTGSTRIWLKSPPKKWGYLYAPPHSVDACKTQGILQPKT